MKQPSKKEIEKLEKEALDTSKWKNVAGFEVGRCNNFLEKWLSERATYEMELVQLARRK